MQSCIIDAHYSLDRSATPNPNNIIGIQAHCYQPTAFSLITQKALLWEKDKLVQFTGDNLFFSEINRALKMQVKQTPMPALGLLLWAIVSASVNL